MPDADIIPIRRARDTGDSDELIEKLTPEEQAIKTLAYHFPRLCNDIAMLVCRPFQLIWDPTTETASTDCKAEVYLSPWYFIEGFIKEGYGSAYHECGHIRWSPFGGELLERAQKLGGENLKGLLNLILDRRDDMLTAAEAPGFAVTLRQRMVYLATKFWREKYEGTLLKLPAEDRNKFLKHMRPRDVYEDFFFAAKWHKRARFRATHKAMALVSRKRLLSATPEQLLWTAQRVQEILGKAPERHGSSNKTMAQLMLVLMQIDKGMGRKAVPQALAQAIQLMVKQYVARARTSGLERLVARLKRMSMVHPGPLSTGTTATVPVKKVPPAPEHMGAYQGYLAKVQPLIGPLVQRLRRIDTPSEFTIHGQDEGELDLGEVARIATRLRGIYQETVVERDIDAELHLAIDCSGSMIGDKVEQAKTLAVMYSEAVRALRGSVVGHLWAFSSNAIYDLGPPDPASAVVTINGEACNSDTHMLRVVGQALAKSRRRRRILLVLCDDGPDSMAEVARLSRLLMSRGIVVVHLLVGVHGTPDIYPFELLYTSMEECISEFPDLLEKIFRHLR